MCAGYRSTRSGYYSSSSLPSTAEDVAANTYYNITFSKKSEWFDHAVACEDAIQYRFVSSHVIPWGAIEGTQANIDDQHSVVGGLGAYSNFVRSARCGIDQRQMAKTTRWRKHTQRQESCRHRRCTLLAGLLKKHRHPSPAKSRGATSEITAPAVDIYLKLFTCLPEC